ncbi:uncharacterized protein PADG_03561 [Paracoccidioides brasiliensis Pb18]|uniref:Uncharacterized protein n=1 Tax=Paracoccidioides brasiliensis (strain Pb18) TaxID=502780 RepID=C1G8H5_PARBD|nr:uncharacterized protein PADG_03561 [Paracoccidioides brasiliensis Pb18]EEH47477.2 hypothetical protein PADG_03561 [Paracoccidioides brasiliensis Pb18]
MVHLTLEGEGDPDLPDKLPRLHMRRERALENHSTSCRLESQTSSRKLVDGLAISSMKCDRADLLVGPAPWARPLRKVVALVVGDGVVLPKGVRWCHLSGTR